MKYSAILQTLNVTGSDEWNAGFEVKTEAIGQFKLWKQRKMPLSLERVSLFHANALSVYGGHYKNYTKSEEKLYKLLARHEISLIQDKTPSCS